MIDSMRRRYAAVGVGTTAVLLAVVVVVAKPIAGWASRTLVGTVVALVICGVLLAGVLWFARRGDQDRARRERRSESVSQHFASSPRTRRRPER
jgi:high-affinity Fe2+/Pb2+ permease